MERSVALQPAGPLLIQEYVSRGSKRKDYTDNFLKYERDLKVPYYLLFNPEKPALHLYRHNRRKYVLVKPNAHGRLAVPPLDIEAALLDDWVRFWYQGELLPLPAELLDDVNAAKERTEQEKQRPDKLQRRPEAAERELDRLRGHAGK